jgi:hypothetical protein
MAEELRNVQAGLLPALKHSGNGINRLLLGLKILHLFHTIYLRILHESQNKEH